MKTNTVFNESALTGLKNIEDEVVSCTISSPPYWGLRSYGTNPQIWGGESNCSHKWKEIKAAGDHTFRPGKSTTVGNNLKKDIWQGNLTTQLCEKCGAWEGELGLEPTKEMFVNHLCDIFDEVKRVTRKDGTCWVNLGDSYSGGKEAGLPDKCLCMIPERFAIEMCNRGWTLRSKIYWKKGNAMPTSASDRFTNETEEIYFFVKNKEYYFEQQFDPYTEPMNRWGGQKLEAKGKSLWDEGTGQSSYRDRDLRPDPRGKNKRNVWEISTVANPHGHFAMFPEKLVETPILAGCPEFICNKCGRPRTKVYEKVGEEQRRWSKNNADESPYNKQGSMQNIYKDKGLTDCGCNAGFRPGIVLDPFMGAGTTAIVAKKLNRDYLGFELNPKYCEICEERLNATFKGLF